MEDGQPPLQLFFYFMYLVIVYFFTVLALLSQARFHFTGDQQVIQILTCWKTEIPIQLHAAFPDGYLQNKSHL